MKTIAKILLAALGYVIGMLLSWALTAALHLPIPAPPPGTTPGQRFGALLLSCPLLIAGVVALTAGLGGAFHARFGALFALLYVCVGVNTVIEGAVFTTTMTPGLGTLLLSYLLPCAFAAVAMTKLFPSAQPAPALPRFRAGQWTWRLLGAWLAFPAIYLVFGLCVSPFVLDYYRAGIAGLRIPSAGVIPGTELLRSALYLLVSVPVVLLWSRSRTELFLSLGFAHAVMVGIFGLAQAYWFPTALRVAHSIEITADSFAYAGVLVLLFARPKATRQLSIAQAASSFRVE